MTGPLTIFSWGYYGWGNATPKLVELVDAAERKRGFEPPLFVDVRFSRSVRAVGFRDKAFEGLVGGARYRWIRKLGNRAIHATEGPAIQIHDPDAADELLDMAVEEATRGRRILFFCSCEMPLNDGVECHRVEVGRLLLGAAKRRRMEVEIVEWPGGAPQSIEVDVSLEIARQVARSRASVPISTELALAHADLPWCSRARLRSSDRSITVLTGPPRYQSTWFLPVIHRSEDADRTAIDPISLRRSRGWDPHTSNELRFAPSCVYTIADLSKLESIADADGHGVLEEQKPWSRARELLDRAQRDRLVMPILFADAADCTRLLYAAVLSDIRIDAGRTTYHFEGLRPIAELRRPQELILLHAGRPIAEGYIRPYALCETPEFVTHLLAARSPP